MIIEHLANLVDMCHNNLCKYRYYEALIIFHLARGHTEANLAEPFICSLFIRSKRIRICIAVGLIPLRPELHQCHCYVIATGN